MTFREALFKPLSRGEATVGFIDPAARTVLAILTIFSPHHWLQCVLRARPYAATDLYFVLWAVIAATIFACNTVAAGRCPAPNIVVTWALYGRLAEALVRELWVTLYRRNVSSSAGRAVVTSLLNYATLLVLFGYLYEAGVAGFDQALVVGLTFGPLDASNPSLAGTWTAVQSVYCFLFLIVVVGAFVARIDLDPTPPETEKRVVAAPAAGPITPHAALDIVTSYVADLEKQIAAKDQQLAAAETTIAALRKPKPPPENAPRA